VGTVDQTMPALFAPTSTTLVDQLVPLAQLGAGVDGTAVLARKGDQLIELLELTFGPDSPRWPELQARLRAAGSVDHPGIRGILAIEPDPPRIRLEGDNSPPLAELVEQASFDLQRVMRILGELARAIAAAHHVGLVHGRLDPWAVHVGGNDRPRIELTGLAMRSRGHEWVARCTAPEINEAAPEPASPRVTDPSGAAFSAAADVYAIGALLDIFATTGGRTATEGVRMIIDEAMATDPDARPSATALVRRLIGAGTLSPRTTLRSGEIEAMRPSRPGLGLQLGRFELAKQLGAGAMGEVWEARDLSGGDNVAIKLLKPEIATDAELLRRFRKEGRVLAKVGSPFIANFVDLNEDKGLHYLVLELVTGGSVAGALRRLSKLPERLALGIIADTCRALAEPHRLGIVHRDIKPDNMMFVRAGIELETNPIGQLIKLGDFGIARLVEQSAPEGATREGAVLGTPEYMAPEQCQGTHVTPATDVYALGCCLFALIAGRPPFVIEDDNQMSVILAHLKEAPPRLDELVPEVSPTVAELVAKCLTKDPKQRPQDAAEVLAVIEQLCDGTAALITAHPAPPIVRENLVQVYTFEWDLQASPEALWPFVSNTEKMNRATGLAPVRFEIESVSGNAPGATHTTGIQRVAGLNLKWKEHPYEWIEGSRHVVLRVFEKGVLRWYVAEVQLERTASGTKLRNTIRLEPRGMLARVLSKWEIGVKYKRKLDKVYRRLDGVLAAGPRPDVDPIDPEVTVSSAAQASLEAAMGNVVEAGVDARAADAVGSYLLRASDQDIARIRPIELAQKFGVPEDAMIDACLHATKHGVLAMVWDVICPSCRIPSNVVDSLRKIEEHSSCKACNLSFDVDFSRAIELAFRATPEVRDVETRTYCIGGPAHFPHVAAQVRLRPGERFALPLTLGAGFYLVRSPQLARGHELRITASGGVRRVDIVLGEKGELPALTAGDQLLTLVNNAAREVLVRVERAGDRAFALSAARAMSCAAFRELFPDQALAPGKLLAVTQATLVVAQLDDAQRLFAELGDSKAFPVATRFFDSVASIAKEYGGTLVKTFGGLALAAFERPGPAVDAALAIQAAVDAHPLTAGRGTRVVVHRGPMMALTQGGRLDYFGQNVELALSTVSSVPPATVGLTSAVCQDIAVAERLPSLPSQLGLKPLAQGAWMQLVQPRTPSKS
jgi:class 3 adenylate cyclase/tRNA A-37 threonylcarbamoyl transferase component Bud32